MILCVYTRTYKHPFGAVSLENHDYYVYPPWTAAISSWEGEMDSATFCQGPELLFFTWATKYVASHVLTIIFFAFFSFSFSFFLPFSLVPIDVLPLRVTPPLALQTSLSYIFSRTTLQHSFHSPVLFPSS